MLDPDRTQAFSFNVSTIIKNARAPAPIRRDVDWLGLAIALLGPGSNTAFWMNMKMASTTWRFVPLLLALVFLGESISFADDHALQLLKTFRSEFIELSPGSAPFPRTFTMGRADGGNNNERPVRTIELEHPFSIARYETTQELWESIMGSNPSRWKGPRNSVEMVRFSEAVSFCEKVTQAMREAKLIGADQEVRLPSEAEWEYATRAGTSTVYSFGDSADRLGEFAWFTGNAAGNDPPVGAKQPNAWGLYDAHGYLWEWCADDYAATLSLHPDQGEPLKRAHSDSSSASSTPNNEEQHVVRGGSWKDAASQLTSSSRRPVLADERDDAIGFRCVLAPVRTQR